MVRGVCDFRNLVSDMENKLTVQSWQIVWGEGVVSGGGSVGKGE